VPLKDNVSYIGPLRRQGGSMPIKRFITRVGILLLVVAAAGIVVSVAQLGLALWLWLSR